MNSTTNEEYTIDLIEAIYFSFKLKVLRSANIGHLVKYYAILQDLRGHTTMFKQFQFNKNSLDSLLSKRTTDELIRMVIMTKSEKNRKRGEGQFLTEKEILKTEKQFPTRSHLIDYYRLHISEKNDAIGQDMLLYLTSQPSYLYDLSEKQLVKFVYAYYNDTQKHLSKNKEIPLITGIPKIRWINLLKKLTKKELCLIIKNVGDM